MNIGLDMMGGDYAPLEAVKGLALYLKDAPQNCSVFCIGKLQDLEPLLAEQGLANHPALQLINAPDVIGYNEHPTKAFKEKPHSSISIGFHMLSTGKVDAFISAGNTGAMLVGSMYSVKVIDGVQRPAIATFVPQLNGETGLLLDVGLNSDCKPEHLNQFAILGSVYAKEVLHIAKPSVGLMNVGEEKEKGDNLTLNTYPLLEKNTQINFYGNVEGRDIFNGKVDVIVCDGFTGNIILKMAESFYEIACKRGFEKDDYIKNFHYETYGGTPVLGVNKPVIIAHGISNDKAFKNMIHQAEVMIKTNFCEVLKNVMK